VTALLLMMAGATALRAQISIGNPLSVDRPDTDNPAATQRNATIQQELRMAGDYLVGKGVPKDLVQSAYWFKKAADQGDPGAQNELGYLYIWGAGVERDETQAFKWFARASGSGSQQAKLNLAVMYLKGMGVARDNEMGRALLTELAEKRNGRAEAYLGVMYLRGYGVAQDHDAAEEWFSRAAKDKNPEGEFAMGTLYSIAGGHEHDFGKAAKLLREAARAGYVPAMYSLAMLLVDHPEIEPRGSGEAVAMLERSAEAGTWESSVELGVLARDGSGVKQDVGEAFRWFTIAAKQGGAQAEAKTQADLEKCRATLAADEQDSELRAAESWLAQHPHADLFVFKDLHSEFPVGEVYAARTNGME
jgi:TPR repeat protein